MIETLHCRPAGAAPTEVRIGAGLRHRLGEWMRGRRAFVLVDGAVDERHPDLVPTDAARLRVRGGEELKTLARAEEVLAALAQAGIDRQDLLVVIGGGSVGDLGGLCGGLWLRGIETWQVPTTLLAMVDSCVGGKTAVNLPAGKNLIGLVHPPALVVVDPGFARDLGDEAHACGLAEAVKMAIGLDAELFSLLESSTDAVLQRDGPVLHEVVARSLAAKIAVVEGDLREHGARRLLNLGHTLGHALEAWSGHSRPHGLCVARGLHFALDVAERLEAIAPGDAARCRDLLARLGFVPWPLPAPAALLPFLRRDKKAAGDILHFVVPTGIGSSAVRPLALDWLAQQLAG